jgi:hypothetical protein
MTWVRDAVACSVIQGGPALSLPLSVLAGRTKFILKVRATPAGGRNGPHITPQALGVAQQCATCHQVDKHCKTSQEKTKINDLLSHRITHLKQVSSVSTQACAKVN